MELISVGSVILNLDRITVLDIGQKEDGAFVLRVLADSSDPVINIDLSPEVPDYLLSLVPHKMRLAGVEALQS